MLLFLLRHSAVLPSLDQSKHAVTHKIAYKAMKVINARIIVFDFNDSARLKTNRRLSHAHVCFIDDPLSPCFRSPVPSRKLERRGCTERGAEIIVHSSPVHYEPKDVRKFSLTSTFLPPMPPPGADGENAKPRK